MAETTTEAAQITPNAAPAVEAAGAPSTEIQDKMYPETAAPAQKTEAPAEIKYELKLPEDAVLDQKRLDEVLTYAKEKKLDPSIAQEILNQENQVLKNFVDTQKTRVQTQIEAWRKQTESDPELGGEKLKENAEMAKRALKQFGSESFVSVLEESGMGNHPELVRMLSRIGRAMADDKLVMAGSQSAGKKSMEEQFYGSDKN